MKSFQRLHERLELPLDSELGPDHLPAVQPPAPLHPLRGLHRHGLVKTTGYG